MFIAIEGTDASGKSSLVEEIKKQLAAKYPGKQIIEYHKGRPLEETRVWVLNEYAISIERTSWASSVAIADRWHWGEVTYAPLKRAHTCKDAYGLLGRAGWRWTELFMASRGMAQFWLYQPLDVVKARLASRGDDFVTGDELDTIIDLYKKAATYTLGLAGTLVPDPDSASMIPLLAQHVIAEAEKVQDSVKGLLDYPEYIGSPKPKVLLVGDKRGGKKPPTILPFMPVNSNSGEFLMQCLPEHLWRNVGIINIADVNGDRLRKLRSVLGSPKIIALGRLAEQGLRESAVDRADYEVVAHPQYVRRFHHLDCARYGEAIDRLSFNTDKSERMNDPWILR